MRAVGGGAAGRGTRIVGRLWVRALRWLERRDWDEGATLMVFGAVVGVAAGLGVVAFYRLIDLSHLLFIQWPESRLARTAHVIYQPLLTAAGVWAAWLLVRRSGIAEGQNVPDVQLAVAKRDGIIDVPPAAVRTVASAFTLGSGGSAGSEGPVAVLGAVVGSGLGRRLRLQPRHLKILVGCGAAAGIAGAFNAPFAGAFFALEEVLGSFSVGAFSPVVIASVVGALTVRPFLGGHPIFHMPRLDDTHPIASALLYPLLGLACGLVSALYARAYLATPRLFARLPGPAWLRPLAGGALTGLIVVASGGILAGNGHLAIPSAVFGGMAWYALIAIAFAKIAATVITLGSGGSGGVFTPTLFIGAALGGGLGVLGSQLAPGGVVSPAAWALVGMAGTVAGATRAPLTAIFMVFEMTDDYSYVIPLMIVAVIAYATAKRFAPYGLYDGWLAVRGEHLAHGVDQTVMEHLHVRDALDARVPGVPPEATIGQLIAAAAATRHGVLPVVEADGSLVGLISHHALREAIVARGDLASVVVAEDLAEPAEALTPQQSLRQAMAAMNARGLDALPVVDRRDGHHRFVGLLARADVLRVYERALARAV
ncbi:MAG TPA: chloride channel protein [Gemmatimonadaceae bacterium]|nr:chloride channel protein [Gemmatimonadaceae bacterium]